MRVRTNCEKRIERIQGRSWVHFNEERITDLKITGNNTKIEFMIPEPCIHLSKKLTSLYRLFFPKFELYHILNLMEYSVGEQCLIIKKYDENNMEITPFNNPTRYESDVISVFNKLKLFSEDIVILFSEDYLWEMIPYLHKLDERLGNKH